MLKRIVMMFFLLIAGFVIKTEFFTDVVAKIVNLLLSW